MVALENRVTDFRGLIVPDTAIDRSLIANLVDITAEKHQQNTSIQVSESLAGGKDIYSSYASSTYSTKLNPETYQTGDLIVAPINYDKNAVILTDFASPKVVATTVTLDEGLRHPGDVNFSDSEWHPIRYKDIFLKPDKISAILVKSQYETPTHTERLKQSLKHFGANRIITVTAGSGINYGSWGMTYSALDEELRLFPNLGDGFINVNFDPSNKNRKELSRKALIESYTNYLQIGGSTDWQSFLEIMTFTPKQIHKHHPFNYASLIEPRDKAKYEAIQRQSRLSKVLEDLEEFGFELNLRNARRLTVEIEARTQLPLTKIQRKLFRNGRLIHTPFGQRGQYGWIPKEHKYVEGRYFRQPCEYGSEGWLGEVFRMTGDTTKLKMLNQYLDEKNKVKNEFVIFRDPNPRDNSTIALVARTLDAQAARKS